MGFRSTDATYARRGLHIPHTPQHVRYSSQYLTSYSTCYEHGYEPTCYDFKTLERTSPEMLAPYHR
jgi:hypothetical protein